MGSAYVTLNPPPAPEGVSTLCPVVPLGPAPTRVPLCSCCIEGCDPMWVGDGECDLNCNTPEYNYDKGDW